MGSKMRAQIRHDIIQDPQPADKLLPKVPFILRAEFQFVLVEDSCPSQDLLRTPE